MRANAARRPPSSLAATARPPKLLAASFRRHLCKHAQMERDIAEMNAEMDDLLAAPPGSRRMCQSTRPLERASEQPWSGCTTFSRRPLRLRHPTAFSALSQQILADSIHPLRRQRQHLRSERPTAPQRERRSSARSTSAARSCRPRPATILVSNGRRSWRLVLRSALARSPRWTRKDFFRIPARHGTASSCPSSV